MDVKGFFQDVHVKAMNQVEAISQKCELPQFTAPSAVQVRQIYIGNCNNLISLFFSPHNFNLDSVLCGLRLFFFFFCIQFKFWYALSIFSHRLQQAIL